MPELLPLYSSEDLGETQNSVLPKLPAQVADWITAHTSQSLNQTGY